MNKTNQKYIQKLQSTNCFVKKKKKRNKQAKAYYVETQ